MKQYAILYKRGEGEWKRLEPNVDANLYDKPEVNAAVAHLRATPAVVGMVVELPGELFNIVVFEQEAEAPRAFKLEEPALIAIPHPDGGMVVINQEAVKRCDLL